MKSPRMFGLLPRRLGIFGVSIMLPAKPLIFIKKFSFFAEKDKEGCFLVMRVHFRSIRLMTLVLSLLIVASGKAWAEQTHLSNAMPSRPQRRQARMHPPQAPIENFLPEAPTIAAIRSPGSVDAGIFELMAKGDLAALAGVLMLAAAAWVVILRRQVRAKTKEIHEWLRREAALKENYRDLLENAIDMVYTRDLEGKITSVNNTAVTALGYSRQELLSMNIRQIVAPEHWDSVQGFLAQSVDGVKIKDAEFEIVTREGARLAVEVRSRLLYEGGKAVGVQGIARNVTERKMVEQQVRLQAAALEVASFGILIAKRDGTILWVNPAFTTLSGYSLPEVD